MTRPQRPTGPVLSDRAPAPASTVPIERDPGTGRWLRGDPSGRGDKGRRSTPHRPPLAALVTAGVLLAAVAVALVVLLGGTDDTRSPVAAPPTGQATSSAAAEPTAEPPPQVTGPRTVPISLTTTAVAPPPGFPPDPSFGVVGEVRPRAWILTGPCDGTGPCAVEHCPAPGNCGTPLAATPTGAGGYTLTSTTDVNWRNPACSGGSITVTLTFGVDGPPEAPSVTGTWTESADPVILPGPALCGIYLGTFAIASA